MSLGFAAGAGALWAQTPASPKMQEPADQKAFQVIRHTHDKGKQLTALQGFTKNYPKSEYLSYAQELILDDMLATKPGADKEIEKQANLVLKGSKKGPDRRGEEASLARELASTGNKGVDLPLAGKWAADAEKHLNEARHTNDELAMYKHFKMPAPDAAELHQSFESDRARVLAAVTQVDMAKGDYAQAARVASDAYAADPHSITVNEERGEIALHNGNNAEALDAFERAVLLGKLTDANRAKLKGLYREEHGGSDSGLEAALDAKYATLYGPSNFNPARAAAIPGGHTALLELFTGSACPPCVGGDIAVEDFAKAYGDKKLVTLAFDQHIPEPDPLANAASLDRAKMYGVNSTPSYMLDGKSMGGGGWDRDHVQRVYDRLNKDVAEEIALPTAVQLRLTASRGADGIIHAQATVTAGDTGRIAKEIVMPADAPKQGKGAKPASAPAPAKPALPPTPHLVVNFALVENDVRYSGENGVRFHADVVRALSKPADGGYPVELGKTADVDAAFDPAAVSKELSAYLAGYANAKDIHFLSTDTALNPEHLLVAAWVQDAGTHRVLDAALVPVEGGQPAVAAK